MTVLAALPAALDLSDAEYLEYFLRRKQVRGVHLPPYTRATLHNARKLLRGEFEFIGESYVLPNAFSWRLNPSRDKEWQIAQHKHYWAVDLLHAWRATNDHAYLRKWIDLISSWLDEMGTGFITLSDAQVEARRVEHWVYAYVILRAEPVASLPASLLRRFLARLAEETGYIATHLKPTRNHRTFQLFAVCLSAMAFPEFDENGRLARLAVEQLTANLLTDILADGVQVELSTHYHQLVLETAVSFLELARANGVQLDPELDRRVARALAFAMHVQWPNGRLPLLNDSDDGCQRELLRRGAALFGDETLQWGASLGREGLAPSKSSVFFDQSGYFAFSDGWGRDAESYGRRQHVAYDCGRVGEGSHSHYDIFNFCFYAGGAPLIVDPGRYTYSAEVREGVDWRHWFKSTAAHNTVAIDDRDQTRYLSRTKHGPDAMVQDREFLLGHRSDWVRAKVISHEYAPVHERFFLYMQHEYLWIADRIEPGDGHTHQAVLRFHLTDRLAGRIAFESDARGAEISNEDLVLSVQTGGLAESRIERGWVSVSYGTKSPAPVLAVSQRGDMPLWFASVVAPRSGNSVPQIVSAYDDGFVVTDIRGENESGRYHDTILMACAREVPRCEISGLTCRARDLAFRRDAQGQVTYVVASGVRELAIEGTQIDVEGSGSVEWRREV